MGTPAWSTFEDAEVTVCTSVDDDNCLKLDKSAVGAGAVKKAASELKSATEKSSLDGDELEAMTKADLLGKL